MSSNDFSPTPYPDVNAILFDLLASIQAVLGDQLVGMYVDGSLANGGFDASSDIDFVVAARENISEEVFQALRAMHDKISGLDTPWAIQLEGSYLGLAALRRHDGRNARHPNIERGTGERLKWVEHGESWNVHRHILHRRGITLLGPGPETLIDPLSPDDLRRAMFPALTGWAREILADPSSMSNHGPYQSYVVLTICRILFTLETGEVASKRNALVWAQQSLDQSWRGLFERAWSRRDGPGGAADPEEVAMTLDLIRLVLDRYAL